jgi:hypothetical protein
MVLLKRKQLNKVKIRYIEQKTYMLLLFSSFIINYLLFLIMIVLYNVQTSLFLIINSGRGIL